MRGDEDREIEVGTGEGERLTPVTKRSHFSSGGRRNATDTRYPSRGVEKECGDKSLQVPNRRQTPSQESPKQRETTLCRRFSPQPIPCRRQTLARCYLPLGQARLRYRRRRRRYGGGDEKDSPWLLGGFLFRAILSLVPSPRVRRAETPVPRSPGSSRRLSSASSLWR